MSFLKIPGFGIWNEPLPNVVSYGASQALTWAKDKLIQAGTQEKEQEPELTPEVVVPENITTTPEVQSGDQELAVQLATTHSVLLEQSLAKFEAPPEVPDTTNDEALAKELAKELAREEEIKPLRYEPPKQTQTKKLEKMPIHVETASKRSKHHHHHKHHSSRSHKNK